MEGDTFHLTAERAVAHCDENTIGVVAILGSTFDGSYEPVKDIAVALDRLQTEKGIDVPLHVDAASGGFVAPFLVPELEWDFRLARVQSINASGHKYGLVYPGVGWAVWRDKSALPRELVFDVNYLGGHMPTFSLNFSRPGSEVVAQYFMFMSLGASGYTKIMRDLQQVAMHIAAGVADMGPYTLISDGERAAGVRLRAQPRDRELHRVRRLRSAARARLARPRLHLPGEPPGPERAADRRAGRDEPRDGRQAA